MTAGAQTGAARLPPSVQWPYFAAAVVLSLAYGATFLLAEALGAAGIEASLAGTVVGAGTLATLGGALFAGRLADRTGLLPLVGAAALTMAAAMGCFALIGEGGLIVALAGGVLLGLGWSAFFMLAPVLLITTLRPEARLEAITMLSGSQMLGIGLAAPIGRAIGSALGNPAAAFASYALAALLAALLIALVRRRMARQAPMRGPSVGLTWAAAHVSLTTRTALPILMAALAAATFSGVSTFQSLYTGARGLPADLFFLVFTVASVSMRFGVARLIGRLRLARLALGLFALSLAGLVLFALNTGSLAMHAAACVLFSLGYGLTYATMNAMAVQVATDLGQSPAAASQVFTIGYFVGLFGFPWVAGVLIRTGGPDAALPAMIGLTMACLAIAATMLRR